MQQREKKGSYSKYADMFDLKSEGGVVWGQSQGTSAPSMSTSQKETRRNKIRPCPHLPPKRSYMKFLGKHEIGSSGPSFPLPRIPFALFSPMGSMFERFLFPKLYFYCISSVLRCSRLGITRGFKEHSFRKKEISYQNAQTYFKMHPNFRTIKM